MHFRAVFNFLYIKRISQCTYGFRCACLCMKEGSAAKSSRFPSSMCAYICVYVCMYSMIPLMHMWNFFYVKIYAFCKHDMKAAWKAPNSPVVIAYMYVCMYIYMCVCVCVYACMCMCARDVLLASICYTHIYIHTNMSYIYIYTCTCVKKMCS
jgi:hypothetical protein